jgi:hypothetical protein
VFTNGAAGAAGGLTTLIAAFGLTWKAVGEFFGRAAAKAEESLWDAQVDWTIANRCTIDLATKGVPSVLEEAGVNAHAATWRAWQEKWPDLSGRFDDRSGSQ